MKKLFCFILAAAMVLAMCACTQPEAPADTPSTTLPTTAPTEPQPTEPKPTEPPQEPAISLDWQEFAFRLEGQVYRLPCNFSEFMAEGWTLKDNYGDHLPLNAYTFMPVYMQKGDLKVMLRLVNPTDAAQPEENCQVDGIWIYEHDGPVSFEVAKRITTDSTPQDVWNAFGAADREDWHGEGDDGGEPTSIHMLRYQTEVGYDQSMTFFFDDTGKFMEISLLNSIPLPDENPDDSCEHQYSQTYTDPTCVDAGSITQTCIHCADVRIEALPAVGHDFQDGICSRCGEADPSVPTEVTYTVTVRSDKGKAIADVIVSVYTGGDEPAATGTTNDKGVATMTLMSAETYTIKLSRIPPGSSCKESYTTTSTRININLTTLSQITSTDHSKANYKVGSTMGEFTLTDTDGNSYTLSQLLMEKDLVILNFWFVNCNPCKAEFPYFEAINEKYSNIQLLTVNHIDREADILALREQMGVTFPMIVENIGLRQGFGINAYPTTVFISPNGKILKIQVGDFKTQAELEALIEQFT